MNEGIERKKKKKGNVTGKLAAQRERTRATCVMDAESEGKSSVKFRDRASGGFV